MGKIKIAFSDFWKDFEPQDNWFFRFLSEHFDIEVSNSPDFLIYSCGGHAYRDFDGIRIFFAGENVRPNFWECDYAMGFDFLERPNYLRLPLYVVWDGLQPGDLIKTRDLSPSDLAYKTKFCSLVVSNGLARERIHFFELLSAYKKVDSGGRFMNNIGGPVPDKMKFMKPYRFTIAFENSSFPGYVTEKIYQPMFSNTIPIYWGSPRIAEEFNPKSFINCHDFKTWEQVKERVMEIDQDEEKYLAMVNEPYLTNNQINTWMQEDRIIDFFSKIFTMKKTPINQTWKKQLGVFERKRRNFFGRFQRKFR